jgi:thiol-disulfide isomerase/thioredoxin
MKLIVALGMILLMNSCFDGQSKVGFEGQLMPSFNILLIDSITKLNTNSIPTGEPVVFFFISPHCPYCKAQTEQIITNMKSLNNIKFYILTTFPLPDLKSFYTHYQLNKYSNISVGLDYDFYFPNHFKVNRIPYLAIYNKDKILKQVFIGNVSASKLKDIVVE